MRVRNPKIKGGKALHRHPPIFAFQTEICIYEYIYMR
jgi:hypothetical protein